MWRLLLIIAISAHAQSREQGVGVIFKPSQVTPPDTFTLCVVRYNHSYHSPDSSQLSWREPLRKSVIAQIGDRVKTLEYKLWYFAHKDNYYAFGDTLDLRGMEPGEKTLSFIAEDSTGALDTVSKVIMYDPYGTVSIKRNPRAKRTPYPAYMESRNWLGRVIRRE